MLSVKRTVVVAIGLLCLTGGFASAQEQYRPIVVSIAPQIDIPLPPDPNLFGLGGGVMVGVNYVLPFLRSFSAGISVNYHLGQLQHDDLGNLGSLSVFSAETNLELRLIFLKQIEPYLSVGAGYFYAFENGDPSSWATNLVLSGRIGAALRATPTLTIGIQSEYRRYRSLYHLIGAGVYMDLWLGSAN